MTGDDYAQWDAAYVLGALSPQERREYEQHLAGCERCREAVAELAGMPAVLSELPSARAVALLPAPEESSPPGAGVVALASAARRDRRRRRVWQVAASVALVGLGGLGGAVLSGAGAPAPDGAADTTQVVLAPVAGSQVSADLTLTPSTWGTQMEWSCDYPSDPGAPAPTDVVTYELVVVGADGERSVVGTWTGDGTAHARGLLASSAIDIGDIRRVELAVGEDLVLAAADLSEA
jgi:hypothetical protein